MIYLFPSPLFSLFLLSSSISSTSLPLSLSLFLSVSLLHSLTFFLPLSNLKIVTYWGWHCMVKLPHPNLTSQMGTCMNPSWSTSDVANASEKVAKKAQPLEFQSPMWERLDWSSWLLLWAFGKWTSRSVILFLFFSFIFSYFFHSISVTLHFK